MVNNAKKSQEELWTRISIYLLSYRCSPSLCVQRSGSLFNGLERAIYLEDEARGPAATDRALCAVSSRICALLPLRNLRGRRGRTLAIRHHR